MAKVKVKIENLEREIEAEVGDDLRTALLENKIEVYDGRVPLTPIPWSLANCLGHGTCGSCLIDVVEGAEGLSDATWYERLRARMFNALHARTTKKPKLAHPRLACLTRCYRDTVIRTMAGSPQGE